MYSISFEKKWMHAYAEFDIWFLLAFKAGASTDKVFGKCFNRAPFLKKTNSQKSEGQCQCA